MTEIEKQAEEYINSIPSTSGECKGSVYSEEKLKQAYKDGWLSRDGAEHRKGRWFVTPDYEIECVGLNSCAGFVNPLFVGNYKIDCIEFIKKEIDGSKSKWHDLRENPDDLPKCEEKQQIIFFVKEFNTDIEKDTSHFCLGFYAKSFMNDDLKVFIEKSKGYECEHLSQEVIKWCELS